MTLDDLTKGNIWTISSAELSQMIIEARKDEDFADYETHYMNIIRTVFDVQYLNRDDESMVKKLEAQKFEVFSMQNAGDNNAVAIRKHAIKKVTDLTLENVQHLEPYEVLQLIKDNMGTGWKGLPLAVQDIIESAFFIDTSTLPERAMHRAGGIIERRKDDGYEVLEIERGRWIEAIFAKAKPKVEKVRIDYSIEDEEDGRRKRKQRSFNDDDENDNENDDLLFPGVGDSEDEDEDFDMPEDISLDDEEDPDMDREPSFEELDDSFDISIDDVIDEEDED